MMNNENALNIGQVSELLEIPAYTIRYWEKEFNEFLRPARSNGRQRQYHEHDLKLLRQIKKMLKEEKYSIAGAKQKLRSQLTGTVDVSDQALLNRIVELIKTNQLAIL